VPSGAVPVIARHDLVGVGVIQDSAVIVQQDASAVHLRHGSQALDEGVGEGVDPQVGAGQQDALGPPGVFDSHNERKPSHTPRHSGWDGIDLGRYFAQGKRQASVFFREQGKPCAGLSRVTSEQAAISTIQDKGLVEIGNHLDLLSQQSRKFWVHGLHHARVGSDLLCQVLPGFEEERNALRGHLSRAAQAVL